ncbi:hypothetical protein BDP55DRAFT_729537 [Colletotrichum godetiae]|uniref:Prephenate dehydratase domain-containing protein n=1 Tax=Colletotrichum godetiae TaxID=1209918 RepID=A0AAJ0EUM8_9PEZI|nr:uncharacterized protein BDP55DRAFT_729537 [Colletotrichum godetiae]KAK1674513.1 hypothetical protein BDP55DRAFT_729537 [Colletotrichum godetiae]
MSDKSQVPAEAVGGGVKPLVGFLGPQASYTHQASLQAFPEDEWDLRPVVNITGT